MCSRCRHPRSRPMVSRWWCRHGWDQPNPGCSLLAGSRCVLLGELGRLQGIPTHWPSNPARAGEPPHPRGAGFHLQRAEVGNWENPKGGRGRGCARGGSGNPWRSDSDTMPPRPERGPGQPGLPAPGPPRGFPPRREHHLRTKGQGRRVPTPNPARPQSTGKRGAGRPAEHASALPLAGGDAHLGPEARQLAGGGGVRGAPMNGGAGSRK